jgi:glycosyltransferase involved in cell wall biosynthesis
MISVLVLTKNEEGDLPGCLDSVAWSDDVHVFDSHSEDRTVQIALERGASVRQRRFDGYASQRNAALRECPFRNPWTLILDADERVPDPLRREMLAFAAAAPLPEVAACRIRRRDFLWGAWLKHAQISPYYIRLVRPERVRYRREVNEVLEASGTIVDLAEPFDHFPFSKGFAHWFAKHNAYSSMEAEQVLKSRAGAAPASVAKALLARDFNERRFHQKELFYRLPARPLLKWLYMMGIRGAFLDGRAGIAYAALQAIYEYMIVLKTRERAAEARTLDAGTRATPRDADLRS